MPSQPPPSPTLPPRIALIHATPLAVPPINEAFARLWPQTRLMNLLDDSLSADHARNHGVLSAGMTQRFIDLARYARGTGAQAILYTCSAFGPAIEAARAVVGVPTLKPNEAMFEDALRLAPAGGKLALIATFEPSLAPMCEEFASLARERGRGLVLTPHYVPEAMAALGRGDSQTHHQLVADKVARLRGQHVILLAQFSMAAAHGEAQERTNATVLTSPDCAIRALRHALQTP